MRVIIMTVVRALTMAATPALAAGWVAQEEVSPLDDSKNVFLQTQSLEPIPGVFGQAVTPTLTIRCKENTTSVFIDWNTFLDIDEKELIYRIDKLPAETHSWGVSTDYEAVGLWNGSAAIPFIKSLFGHDILLVRVIPHGESPVTATFYIEGLKAAAVPLMKACHWQSQTAQTGPAPQNQAEPTEEDTFAALLKTVEQLDRRDQSELEQSGTGQRRSDQGQAQSSPGEGRLTFGEIDALRRQIASCWTPPIGIDGIEDIVVQLRIQVRPDRTVEAVTIEDQDRLGRDPKFRAVAQSASRAVDRCSPLQLPPGKYTIWRDIVMSFYPEDAISG